MIDGTEDQVKDSVTNQHLNPPLQMLDPIHYMEYQMMQNEINSKEEL